MNKIEDNFVPYEIAIKLKELGFDKECLCYINPDTHNIEFFEYCDFERTNSTLSDDLAGKKLCTSPLYQQVLQWFREKYDIHINIINKYSLPSKGYFAQIIYHREDILRKPERYEIVLEEYPKVDRGVYETGTYEEALQEAILKAIEIKI